MSGKCLHTVKTFNVGFNKRKSVMNILDFLLTLRYDSLSPFFLLEKIK